MYSTADQLDFIVTYRIIQIQMYIMLLYMLCIHLQMKKSNGEMNADALSYHYIHYI